MTTPRRFERPWVWTVLFWVSAPVYLYSMLWAVDGSWWLTAAVTAVAVAACVVWTRLKRRSRAPSTARRWHVICCVFLALISALVIAYGVRELTRGVTASVGDTMDPRFVACGSVPSPIPAGDLEVSFPALYPVEPRSTLSPIPAEVLSPRCDDRLAGNTNFAGGAILGGLIVLARSIGHAVVVSGRTYRVGHR